MIKRILINLIFFFPIFSYSSICCQTEGFADLVEKLSPAVVNISSTQVMKVKTLPGLEEFEQFFQNFGLLAPFGFDEEHAPSQKRQSLGSGFIIDPQGYIVTNNHVVSGAEEITVTLNNEETYEAKIIGIDGKTDLALLKIEAPKDLPYVKFADSNKARVGDIVITIGNPFGLGGSVTSGIISARSRNINAGAYDDFIQTDAAINTGNSGGPMFNIEGDVIGINTAILSPSGGNVGIGFAIPSSLAEPIIMQLKTQGKVTRGWIGVKIENLDKEIADSLGIKETHGAIVVEVEPNSPASKAGLAVGDIITKFNGQEVNSSRALPKLVMKAPLGKKVEMTVIRGKEYKTLKITIEENKNDELSTTQKLTGESNQTISEQILGISVAPLTPELKAKYRIKSNHQGLIVTNITKNSPTYNKIRIGDLLITANNHKLDSTEKLNKIIETSLHDNKHFMVFLVARNNQTGYVTLPIKKPK